MADTAARQLSAKLKPPGSKIDKRQITRNRTSYSCMTCRRRKVKCDKVHPICGGCQKANEECLYTLPENQESNGFSEESKSSTALDLKKRKIGFIQDGSATSPANENGAAGSVSPNHLRAIEDQLQRLSTLVDSLRSNSSNDEHSWLRNLLTPMASGSEKDTEDGQPPRNLSLGMFQSATHGSVKDASELSKPLSSLRLGQAEQLTPEDSFWNHITSEINQLNEAMRRQHNTYVNATSIQNDACTGKLPEILEPRDHLTQEKNQLSDQQSFQKEAGLEVPCFYDPDSSCPCCRLMPFAKSTLLQDISVKTSPKLAREHLHRHVPSSSQSNVLFRCWLSGVHPLLPVLIPTEIQKMHEKFWSQNDPNATDRSGFADLGSAALMYAIWYAGSLSLSLEGFNRWFPGMTRAKLSARLHDQVVLALHLSEFSRNSTLHTLAAFIIICSLPASEEDPTQATLYLQLIVRLSMTMGLHREPTLFNMSVAEEGMRRRLWWHVIQLDVSQVVATGYPSLISETFCDTRIICEDHDALTDKDTPDVDSETASKPMSSNGASPPAQGSVWESYRTFSHVARAKSIISCAFRSVVSTHLSAKALTNTDMAEMKRVMTSASEQVNYIIKQIPSKGLPELGFTPNGLNQKLPRVLDRETSMADPISLRELGHYTDLAGDPDTASAAAYFYRSRRAAYNKWARINLSMMNDKLHCVAYAPFLKNTKSKLWNVGRQCALHNCHSFLRKFISVASDHELEPFWWSWPAMYGPMHAALIVLVDLYERPRSVEAPRSRELIDSVFAYSSPERGIVGGPNGVTVHRPMREGGVEAWDMLRGLRSAAWQKAGLDPQVLWKEADEIDIGFVKPLTDAQRIAQSIREDACYESNRDSNQYPTKNQSDAENVSYEQGVHYAFRLSQHEMLGTEGPEAQECGKAVRDRFFQEIGNNERQNPAHGLAWRSDQQKMPFPLSANLEACSGSAAHTGETPGHLLGLGTHVPRPGMQRLSCSAREDPSDGFLDGANNTEHKLNGNPPPDPRQWAQVSSVQHPAEPKSDRLSAEVHNQNGEIWNNGVSHNTFVNAHVQGQSHQQDQSVTNGTRPESQYHRENPPTEADLGFDWEKWDSVFGQYSGFTDMMEDVKWHDYLEE
ncbi:uncharacterized protein A1O9_07100 [Exophiala aquamarina CBS 119918]|uniref:Zn(2)-C6 fungal-type domain-containing protein n=1 Tax=Exophiala aquamarina CBS 119918 TaxID=1182545 RepID=A0A072PN08_9EURO|nr:uncharacterized protein A1O9_07100 [Exophiala aquamarina CBS 119918]KEF56910.1 hypothetical protein A1O9_07100 [Exophiala aquamarina CBS 119918]